MCVKILQKNDFVEKVFPANWLCLYMFRPFRLNQLNCLTTINMLSLLSGLKVSGSISGSDKDFYVCLFVLLYLCLTFKVLKNSICHENLQFHVQCFLNKYT